MRIMCERVRIYRRKSFNTDTAIAIPIYKKVNRLLRCKGGLKEVTTCVEEIPDLEPVYYEDLALVQTHPVLSEWRNSALMDARTKKKKNDSNSGHGRFPVLEPEV